ncbi:hypothetical protein [Legionella oakridgensis]|uniref:Uncharacterized protein n=2 Tax=Legionella oakridgensis TaxID=29423 RepID=W0BB50_9GAMM|nr:hypothetical protein [Legionella oakridgensis]AHE67090.1 hypothetical protein Loa_01541 [Legionella oakridgensis ATCC 33761 = DSM 21215]KTD44450.1 hypothetical protein Loak_0150 [Legionella oakridgensis]STY20181.1 Uncharacterised protein [Legionella longbeachae]
MPKTTLAISVDTIRMNSDLKNPENTMSFNFNGLDFNVSFHEDGRVALQINLPDGAGQADEIRFREYAVLAQQAATTEGEDSLKAVINFLDNKRFGDGRFGHCSNAEDLKTVLTRFLQPSQPTLEALVARSRAERAAANDSDTPTVPVPSVKRPRQDIPPGFLEISEDTIRIRMGSIDSESRSRTFKVKGLDAEVHFDRDGTGIELVVKKPPEGGEQFSNVVRLALTAMHDVQESEENRGIKKITSFLSRLLLEPPELKSPTTAKSLESALNFVVNRQEEQRADAKARAQAAAEQEAREAAQAKAAEEAKAEKTHTATFMSKYRERGPSSKSHWNENRVVFDNLVKHAYGELNSGSGQRSKITLIVLNWVREDHQGNLTATETAPASFKKALDTYNASPEHQFMMKYKESLGVFATNHWATHEVSLEAIIHHAYGETGGTGKRTREALAGLGWVSMDEHGKLSAREDAPEAFKTTLAEINSHKFPEPQQTAASPEHELGMSPLPTKP